MNGCRSVRTLCFRNAEAPYCNGLKASVCNHFSHFPIGKLLRKKIPFRIIETYVPHIFQLQSMILIDYGHCALVIYRYDSARASVFFLRLRALSLKSLPILFWISQSCRYKEDCNKSEQHPCRHWFQYCELLPFSRTSLSEKT